MAIFRDQKKKNGATQQVESIEVHMARFWEWVVSDLGIYGSSGRRVTF
jgi:hypothetical protein